MALMKAGHQVKVHDDLEHAIQHTHQQQSSTCSKQTIKIIHLGINLSHIHNTPKKSCYTPLMENKEVREI